MSVTQAALITAISSTGASPKTIMPALNRTIFVEENNVTIEFTEGARQVRDIALKSYYYYYYYLKKYYYYFYY